MKNILITGISSGIGEATAKYFVSKGWNVVGTVLPGEANDLKKIKPENLKIIELDVRDSGMVERSVKAAIEHLGSIDVLVNNAGYGLAGPFESLTDEQLLDQFEVNLFGAMRLTRAVLPFMRAKGEGTIVFVSSMFSRMSMPFFSAYSSSKWALEGFAEGLYQEVSKFGIRIRLIEPGSIKTKFFENKIQSVVTEELKVYDERYSLFIKRIDQIGARGADPLIVAKEIYKAAGSSNKLRRTPDGTAKLLIFMRKILPLSIFSKLISKFVC